MNQFTHHAASLAGLLLLISIAPGCTKEPPPAEAPASQAPPQAMPTNRVAIPPAVRSNLGITFAAAERRRIEDTLRAPGRFEYLPTATREYRTMLPGRVDLLVDQFDRVDPGTPLYRLDSPDWRDIQQAIVAAESAVEQVQTTLDSFEPLLTAHQRHEQSLQESIAVWTARVEKLNALREAGGGRMSEFTAARAALATAQADLASVQEKTAELNASHAQADSPG